MLFAGPAPAAQVSETTTPSPGSSAPATPAPTPAPAASGTPAPSEGPAAILPGLTGNDKRTVTVLVKPIEPFVIGDPASDAAPSGFSVDLWQAIAERAGWTTEWKWTDTVSNQINAVSDKEVDAAIGAITMTAEREAKIDFSLRMFSSSLGIVTPIESGASSGFLSVIFSPQVGRAVRVILVAILVFAVIIFALRRRSEDFPKGIVRGFGHSLWLSGQAVMGKNFNNVFTGGRDPSRVLGRILFLVWLWVAILLAGYIGGSITSVMTVKQLNSGISGPEDLINVRVVAPEGTTSSDFLTAQGIGHAVVPTYADGLAALQEGRYDAMIFDRPVLEFWLAGHPASGLQLVNVRMGAEPYGFALQQDSELRQQVNIGLLAVSHEGTYAKLYEQWFGAVPQDTAG